MGCFLAGSFHTRLAEPSASTPGLSEVLERAPSAHSRTHFPYLQGGGADGPAPERLPAVSDCLAMLERVVLT